MFQRSGFIFSSFVLLTFIGGCAEGDLSKDVVPETQQDRRYDSVGKLFGPDALTFGGDSTTEGETGIGVNSYLWRGSLKALSFMPLQSADPFGGIIITDWYTSPVNSQERFKATVVILSRQLRSNGLQVQVFCQEKNAKGEWKDITPNPRLQRHFEESILLQARQLKAKAG